VVGATSDSRSAENMLRSGKFKNKLIYQEEITITGRVTDKSGKPLVGVTIQVKDKNIGTITDNDGNYELEVPSDAEMLIFSFIGMFTE